MQYRPDRKCLRECLRRIGFAQVENGKTGDDIADNRQIIADENVVYDIAEIAVVLLKARDKKRGRTGNIDDMHDAAKITHHGEVARHVEVSSWWEAVFW